MQRLLCGVVSLVFLPVFLSDAALAQTLNSPTNNTSTLQVLQRMLVQSGWTTIPSDAIAIGSIRDFSSAPTESAKLVVSGHGPEQLRFDLTIAGTSTSTVINGRRAARFSSETVKQFPMGFAVSSRIPVFPFYTLANLGSSKAATFVGAEAIGNDHADVIEIIPQVDFTDPSAEYRQRAERYKVWISRTSGLLIQVAFVRLGTTNSNVELHYIRRYSNYKNVNGRMFAFHQEQWLEGEPYTITDFTDVKFDTGVSDSLFAIPATVGGR